MPRVTPSLSASVRGERIFSAHAAAASPSTNDAMPFACSTRSAPSIALTALTSRSAMRIRVSPRKRSSSVSSSAVPSYD